MRRLGTFCAYLFAYGVAVALALSLMSVWDLPGARTP